MYYKESYNSHKADTSFKNLLRSSNNNTEEHKVPHTILINPNNKPTKHCINTSLKSSRAFQAMNEKPEIKPNLKYQYSYSNNLGSHINFTNKGLIPKENSNKKMNNNSSSNIFNIDNNIDTSNSTNKGISQKNLRLSSLSMDLDRELGRACYTKDSKALDYKVKFLYGSNPLEVVTEENHKTITKDFYNKNKNKADRMKNIFASNQMKDSLLSNNKLTKDNTSVFNKTQPIGKITTTPKNVLKEFLVTNKNNRKAKISTSRYDPVNKKFFYMG